MSYFLGIDLGTSGVKAVLFSEDGQILCTESESYPLYQPHNGWAEQDPLDWKNGTFEVLKRIAAAVPKEEILGIGVSGQMHGLVALDANGEPLCNSLIWCDQRTKDAVEEIERTIGKERYLELTLNAPNTSFTLSKLLWLRQHRPEIYSKMHKVLLPKDYINYCLTGQFATDVSDASGTGYFDVTNRTWSKEILEVFSIPESILPNVFESAEKIGTVSPAVAKKLGLSASTAVAAGAGDQAAAALGGGILEENTSTISLGSSGVVFTALKKPCFDPLGRTHTFCHAVPGMWHMMGVTQACGLSVSWFKENFAKALSFAQLEEKAKEEDTTGLLYLPYLMGERTPHLDADCRGAFTGLSAQHNVYTLYKALLEGICFSLKDCFSLIENTGIRLSSVRVCGGGTKSPLWLSLLADILEHPLQTSESAESGALGVAMLASVASSAFPSVQTAALAMRQEQKPILTTPTESAEEKAALSARYTVYKALYRGIKTAYSGK